MIEGNKPAAETDVLRRHVLVACVLAHGFDAAVLLARTPHPLPAARLEGLPS